MQRSYPVTPPPTQALVQAHQQHRHSPEDESFDCPLCMEEMDPTDRHFKPCPCGYQVCRFCWNRIRQNENERCPACRRMYTDDAVEFTPLSSEELAGLRQKKKQQVIAATTTRKEFQDEEEGPVLASRRHLIDVRVTQKNLVYVIGIPIEIADEPTLKLEEYFGRFGRIVKLVINRRAYVRTTGTGAISNAAAYITFSKDEEALKAIKQIDGKMIDGAKLLRATYGTTKYCAHFLRGRQCPKTGCLYLHHEVYENEVSTGLDSNSVSPPSSPVPLSCSLSQPLVVQPLQVQQLQQKEEPLESDRTRSFFERIQRWSRMDELLADLGPMEGSEQIDVADFLPSSLFNPFDGIIEKDYAGAKEGKRLIPIQELFPCPPGLLGSADAKPAVADYRTVEFKTTESKTTEKKFTITKKVLVNSPTPPVAGKTFTVITTSSKTPSAQSSPLNTKTIDKKVAKKPAVSNENLFSVLHDDSEQALEEEPAEITPEQVEETVEAPKKVAKKKVKKPIEDDLDVLLREVGMSPASLLPSNISKNTKPIVQGVKKPQEQPPLQQSKTLKMEEEAARRVVELEQVLRSSKLEAREIEEKLRESIMSFLQNMKVPLDDDYFPDSQ